MDSETSPAPLPPPIPPTVGRRRGKTRRSVLIADQVAKWGITIGGFLVIGAVLLIGVFLVLQVVPLFLPAKSTALAPAQLEGLSPSDEILFAEVDEFLVAAVVATKSGELHVYEAVRRDEAGGAESFGGKRIATKRLFPAGKTLTAFAHTAVDRDGRTSDPPEGLTALGFSDGSMLMGGIRFKSSYLEREEITPALRRLAVGGRTVMGDGVVERLPGDLFRISRLEANLKTVKDVPGNDEPIIAVDYRITPSGKSSVILKAGGELFLTSVTETKPIGGRPPKITLDASAIKFSPRGVPPKFLRLNGLETQLFVGWEDGELRRYDLRNIAGSDPTQDRMLETIRAAEAGAKLTDVRYVLGDQSLETADSRGHVTVWFPVPPPDSTLERWTARFVEFQAGRPGPALSRRDSAAFVRKTTEFATWLKDPKGDGPKFADWMKARGEEIDLPADGRHTVAAHGVKPHAGGAAVTAAGMSPRNKGLVTATADGQVWLRHVTSGQVIAELDTGSAKPVAAVQISPKVDAVFALDGADRAALWRIDNPHPEITLGTAFGKVWYEGAAEPAHVWQSSSGDVSFEPKFGLVALIFGTFKGTLYALLFAVPIAVCAAVYTSEFLTPGMRTSVKPAIELMASLPSVVLGFIAALVAAPWIENWVLGVILMVAVVPAACLLGGYLWQIIPRPAVAMLGTPKVVTAAAVLTAAVIAAACFLDVGNFGAAAVLVALIGLGCTLTASGFGPLPAVLPLAVLAGWAALSLGDPVEQWLMAGDFRAWLERRAGSARPLWTILLLPLALLVVGNLARSCINPLLSGMNRGVGRPTMAAVAELVKVIGVLAASVGLSFLAACVLTALDWDPRGALVDTYVQRNTLVVSFFMGFAVIPIIYTISEDALNAVPESLRSASLGCGATRWQTAVRVVLPTAMSGVFSAVMVGLGRAVGETMIVVMATGNTPIMDVNPFNGLRALSATIAVELPEADEGGTLYRMLFFSGLVLFAMTFVINTAAEIVRMRFRKRAFQL